MAESKTENDWTHTASMLALTVNCHRDPKKSRAASPNDFMPSRPKKDVRLQGGIQDLKKVFVDRKR
jgi:hypothetical protein